MILRKTIDEELPKFLVAMAIFVALSASVVSRWPEAEPWLRRILGMKRKPAFGLDIVKQILQSGYPAWVCFMWFCIRSQILGVLLALVTGMGLIAREREHHTLAFLLSLPVSRTRVFMEKFMVGLLMLAACVYVGGLVPYLLAAAYGEQISARTILNVSTIQMSMFFLFYCVAVLFSVFFRDRVRAGAAGFVVVIVLLLMATRKLTWDYSPFHYFDWYRTRLMFGIAAKEAVYPWKEALYTALIGLGIALAAWLRFRRIEP